MTDELGSVPESPSCPKCDGPMSRRTSKRGSQFWGCDRYPQCNATIDIQEPNGNERNDWRDEFRAYAALGIFCELLKDRSIREGLRGLKELEESGPEVAVRLADELIEALQ